jgi:putative CocE/NonD family hydrolase
MDRTVSHKVPCREPVMALYLAAGFMLVAAADAATSPTLPSGAFAYHADPNVFVPMRDGVRLATDLYLPDGPAGARYPVVLIRTPYGNVPGHNFNDAAIQVFASHGFVVAVQDKRGKYRSEGVYMPSGGDANDGYDTVDWLSKQPWSNGRIGTYGCSYLGDIQIFMAQTRHPALKAMIPQASGSAVGSAGSIYQYFGVRKGGAINWAASIGWFAEHGQKTVPKLPTTLSQAEYTANLGPWNQPPKSPTLNYPRAWYHLPMTDALRNQGMPPSDFEDSIGKPLTDPYWSTLPYMTPSYVSDVPALFVNSWYDFGADVTLFEFNWFREHSASQLARDNQYFLMSPGVHCSSEAEAGPDMVVGARPMGDTRFDYWHAYLTWFDRWLKEDPAASKVIAGWPKVRYFLMGGNAWKSAPGWPVPGLQYTNYFLASRGHANSVFGDGALVEVSGAANSAASDTFVYDPASPVPSLGGALCCTGTSDALPGAVDQRPVEARDDVLVYTTEPLARGRNVTGPVEALLYVSSTAVDTDFTAKLVDVYPDGRAFNVLEGILRVRYREGFDKEVWLEKNKVYPVRISLGATSNHFGPGHRIRLEVSSSNFPEFDRNLNVGGANSEATQWVTATNTVHHAHAHASYLRLPIAPE